MRALITCHLTHRREALPARVHVSVSLSLSPVQHLPAITSEVNAVFAVQKGWRDLKELLNFSDSAFGKTPMGDCED